MRIGLICGGPSAERGISLNSAHSVMEHLKSLGWEIIPYYCDLDKKFYRLSPEQLYSNTPYDFDFKVKKIAKSLTEDEFIDACREVDIVFPVIHGEFGEDGKLQKLFEKYGIPFVGSSSKSCRRMFDKVKAKEYMKKMKNKSFDVLPHICIKKTENKKTYENKVRNFFKNKKVMKFMDDNKVEVVIKPSANGSSIGVKMVDTPEKAMEHIEYIFAKRYSEQVLIEPRCRGREFTVIVLQNQKNEPVALIPTQIDLKGGEILSTRNKYLPSCQVEYCCPPLFSIPEIKQIQEAAQNLFIHFKMSDFARLDGWLLELPREKQPIRKNQLIFSDFNPISGMEQNSDMFIQGSRIGFTHQEMLQYIVTHAAKRKEINCTVDPVKKNPDAQKIYILFGGVTSERQVSLMSGMNVWLKLLYEPNYLPSPYMLGPNHEVWELSYSFMLNYTVEEILNHFNIITEDSCILEDLAPSICKSLNVPEKYKNALIEQHSIGIDKFCEEAVKENAFIFIALHGGEGENGWLQDKLNQYNLAYNGSDVEASSLCMDKYETGKVLYRLKDPLLTSLQKIIIPLQANFAETFWNDAKNDFKTTDILIKPQADGCSTGITRLKFADDLKIYLTESEKAVEVGEKLIKSQNDLNRYLQVLEQDQTMLAARKLSHQPEAVELPTHVNNFILEPFIETDEILHAKYVGQNIICSGIPGSCLVHTFKTGWIELTVGVLEENGIYHALSPSITVVEGNVLSLEEKFQGGTGVNLTPPPEEIITSEQIVSIKEKTKKAAKALGIQGYARIDIFFNTINSKIIVIEANSLPGLTPSTVIYHQALAEVPPLTPQEFLSKLIELGIERRKRTQ